MIWKWLSAFPKGSLKEDITAQTGGRLHQSRFHTARYLSSLLYCLHHDNFTSLTITWLSMQTSTHSPITDSESPTVQLAQSSKQRIRRWRDTVLALEGHQKRIDGCMRKQGSVEAPPFSASTSLPLQPFPCILPIRISPAIRRAHIRDIETTSGLLRPWHLNRPYLSLSLTYSPTSCWRLFSPLYFSWLSWILLVLLLIFTLGLILLIHPFWAVEFLYSSNLCRLCQANSCPWVSFLFAFSTHVQWSLGWRRKSWKCIGWDCSKPILCGLRLALATVLLFFYLYFLSWFCRHFLHLSRSPYHSCILHSAHELICYVLYSIQKTQLNFLIPSPPGHCTL